jgi:hypothetical protein
MIRSKFKVKSKTIFQGEQGCVKLDVVQSGSEENKVFSEYTPSGSIEIYIQRRDTLDLFEVGAEYYVDFTKAEA